MGTSWILNLIRGKLSDIIDPLIDNVDEKKGNENLRRIAMNTKTLIGNYVRRNRTEASTVKKIWEGELLTGTEALGYNLVDGIVEDFQSQLEQDYPGIKVRNCTNKGYYERVHDLVGPLLVKSEFDLVKKKIAASLLSNTSQKYH